MSRDPEVMMIGPGPDVIGGVVTVTKTMMAAAPSGIELTWHAAAGPGERAEQIRSMVAAQVDWLLRMGRGPRPDLLHLHVGSLLREGVYGLEGKLLGVPYVVHTHGYIRWVRLQREHPRRFQLAMAFLRSAQAIVSVTQALGPHIREWLPDGPPFLGIPNPIDLSLFPTPAPRVSTDAPVVLFVGWMIEAKGIFDMLDAIPQVLEQAPGTRFVFAGDGVDFARWRDEVDKRALWGPVEALGWVTGGALDAAYQSADLLVLPSHAEGMPVVVLEAMALGIPVVATDVAGVPEEVVDGETGVLFSSHDIDGMVQALVPLCQDPVLRARMGAAGRRRIEEHFSTDVIMARWRELWLDAMS